jgi:alpha-beta hydrolase superfamily lysophospholipase
MPAIERASGWTRSADGTALFWRSWRSPSPRAGVVIIHGLGEHSGRYDHVGQFLAGHGFDSWAGDCRGHGRSPGPRVHVDDFGAYADDAGAFLELAASTAQPLFLIGHSQGGLVALLRARRRPEGLRGVVVSSPYLAGHPAAAPSAGRRAAAKVLLRLAPSFLVASGLDTGMLSHAPGVEERYLADPLVSRKVSAAWFRAARVAQKEVIAGAPGFAVPALVMTSGDDRLVDPAATRAWAERAPRDRTTYLEWPGLYHEMFNELEKDKVLERVAEWIEERAGTSV